MKMVTRRLNTDGTWTEDVLELPNSEEFDQLLAETRAYWKELRDAGTPYWCIHENRGVDHPKAYWWNDHPRDEIYCRHGVRCRDCGGYIQEG